MQDNRCAKLCTAVIYWQPGLIPAVPRLLRQEERCFTVPVYKEKSECCQRRNIILDSLIFV